MACINFHILELQDGVVIDRAVPDEARQRMIDTLFNWQKEQLTKKILD